MSGDVISPKTLSWPVLRSDAYRVTSDVKCGIKSMIKQDAISLNVNFSLIKRLHFEKLSRVKVKISLV